MRQRSIKGALPFALALAVISGTTGCGKKTTPAATSQPATVETPDPSRPSQQSQASTQPASANNEPDLAEINRNLIRWIVGHKKRPANFEEFAATAGAPIPPPPPGKKYILGPNVKVQLVNQ